MIEEMASAFRSRHEDAPENELGETNNGSSQNTIPEMLGRQVFHSSPAADPNNTISLPWLLQCLFGLNGLTLTLQSLSLMYIVNTRVEIPLAYLPTYGALAFLPYSLKPIYAFLSSSSSSSSKGGAIIPRHYLLPGLLTASATAILGTSLIPPGGVVLAFVLAFVRGITDSWAELCLGLSLIDHARDRSQQQNQPQQGYDVLASLFQSQAATARNMGSLAGTIVTCLLFIQRQVYHPDRTQLTGRVSDMLLIATGLLQLMGALCAAYYRETFRAITTTTTDTRFDLIRQTEAEETIDTFNDEYHDGDNDDNVTEDNNTTSLQQQQQQQQHPTTQDEQNVIADEESAFLRDDDSNNSHPSYSSQEDRDVVHSLDIMPSSPLLSDRNRIYSRTTNLMLVVTLQLVIILIAMKDPFVEWTSSHTTWRVLVSTLVIAIVLLALAMYRNRWWQTSHRVGLFLILRHAVPSGTMILSSYYYGIFKSSPLLLQLLSLLGRAVTTISSWSYGKWLSGFGSGNAFLTVVACTTILAALASMSNLALLGESASSFSSNHTLFWIAASIRVLDGFFGEWAFLPDVILATTSLVTVEGQQPQQQPDDDSHSQRSGRRPLIVATGSGDGSNPSTPTATQQRQRGEEIMMSDNNIDDDDGGIAVKYGTMISCIDFGDQLGAMLAGPLVVLLGISRENNFLHLDRFIVVCSLLSILSLPLLLLIIRPKR